MIFKKYKSDHGILMSKSLTGFSSSQLCRRAHCWDGQTLRGEKCPVFSLPVPLSLCWWRLAVVQADLCFLESVLSITLAAQF